MQLNMMECGQLGTVLCKLVFTTVLERALSTMMSIIAENPPRKSAKYFCSCYILKLNFRELHTPTLYSYSTDAAASEYLEDVKCLSRY